MPDRVITGRLDVEAIVVHERTAIVAPKDTSAAARTDKMVTPKPAWSLFQPRSRTMISTITIALTVTMSAMWQFAVLQAWVCFGADFNRSQ